LCSFINTNAILDAAFDAFTDSFTHVNGEPHTVCDVDPSADAFTNTDRVCT
jgi:hypothetical protein